MKIIEGFLFKISPHLVHIVEFSLWVSNLRKYSRFGCLSVSKYTYLFLRHLRINNLKNSPLTSFIDFVYLSEGQFQIHIKVLKNITECKLK